VRPAGVSLIAWRSLTRQRARSATLILGVALGVAISFGVDIASASATRSIAQMVAAEFGSATVVIGPTEGSSATTLMPAALLTRVQAIDKVARASGELDLGVSLAGAGSRSTQAADLKGVDISRAGLGGSIPLQAGRLARPGAAEVDLPASMARALRVGVGDRVVGHAALAPPASVTNLVVVGLVGSGGAELDAPGVIAFTSSATTASMIGSTGFNQLDVQLAAGVNPDTWIAAHRAKIGPGVVVLSAADTQSALRVAQKSIQAALTGVSAMALFVCMFLVYLSFSTRVLERTRIYGALYSMGTTSSQLLRAVTGEAVLIGVFGGLLGLGLGVVLAIPMIHLLNPVNGLTPPLIVPPSGAVSGVIVGVVIALIGATSPALRARRLTPIEALRADHEVTFGATRGWVLGLSALVGGVALDLLASQSTLGTSLAFVAVLFGATRLVPPLMRPIARVLGRATARLSPGVGTVAVMHLARERQRSAYTLSLVMVVLAMTFAVASGIGTVRDSMDRQIAQQYRAQLRLFDNHFDAHAISAVRATPGVAGATPILGGNYYGVYLADHPNEPVRLSAIDPASYFEADGLSLTTGAAVQVRAELSHGGAVVLPDNVAGPLHLRAGDHVNLATTVGVRSFLVAGSYADLVNGGAMILSADDAAKFFNSPGPDELDVLVAPDADVSSVARTLEHRLAAMGVTVGVSPTSVLVRAADHATSRLADLVYGAVGVAGLVGLLGLANTLVMSVIDRTRELGLLRSLGADAHRASTMVVVETATLVGAAVLLAVPLSALLIQITARVTSQATGVPLGISVPLRVLPGLLALLVLGALVAVAVPLRRIRRLDPVTALRAE
jgi:putative ABC transport system permease protein